MKTSLNEMRHLLSYHPRKGYFTWKVSRNSYGGGVKIGDIAGTGAQGGRIQIGVNGKIYRAHRLAFLFMTGKPVPKSKEVDHINGNPSDNRWKNLRLVTHSQNNMNQYALKTNNTSGCRGVSRISKISNRENPWMARICVRGKIIHLGVFPDKQSAIAARKAAEPKYFGRYAAAAVA